MATARFARQAACAFCLMTASGGLTALAGPIYPGFDLYATDPSATVFDIPLIGPVPMKGQPIGPGNTDTIVERLAGIDPFDVGSGPTTLPVELVALSLVSVDPVRFGSSFFDIEVTAGRFFDSLATPVFGAMTIDHSHSNGGLFSAVFEIDATLVLTEVGNADNQITVSLFQRFETSTAGGASSAPWSHTPPTNDAHDAAHPAGGFHAGVRPEIAARTLIPLEAFFARLFLHPAAGTTCPATCDDGDACTIDRCDADTTECVHTPIRCFDGNPYTVNACIEGECVLILSFCDDGDPFTIDFFARGACRHIPRSEPPQCSHDNECNDDNACTTDVCTAGRCVNAHVPDCALCNTRDECDDGLVCTHDLCTDGKCAHRPIAGCVPCGNPLECFDEDPCTIDACGEGVCFNLPIAGCTRCTHASACDDNDPCTLDHCVAGRCVHHAGACPTIVVNGCDTEVLDQTLSNDLTITDLVDLCAAGVAEPFPLPAGVDDDDDDGDGDHRGHGKRRRRGHDHDDDNHGRFVSCVSRLTRNLEKADLITGHQRSEIIKCAARKPKGET